jgi:hypothetical protein
MARPTLNSNSNELRNVMNPSLHSTTIHFTSMIPLNFSLFITFVTLFKNYLVYRRDSLKHLQVVDSRAGWPYLQRNIKALYIYIYIFFFISTTIIIKFSIHLCSLLSFRATFCFANPDYRLMHWPPSSYSILSTVSVGQSENHFPSDSPPVNLSCC